MNTACRAVILSLLFLIAAGGAFHQIEDFDLWMHLRSGRYMVEHRTLLRKDVFSYTVEGKPWVNHQWLAQVLLHLVEQAAGFNGLIVLTTAIVVTVFVLLFFMYYHPDLILPASAVTLVTVLAADSRFITRPEIFTLLLTAVFFRLLSRAAEREKYPGLVLLIPLQILWANLHAGFVIGIGMSWAFAAGTWLQRRRVGTRMGAVLSSRAFFTIAVLVTLASLLNPFGARLLAEPFRQVGSTVFMKEIGEWSSPFAPGPLGEGFGLAAYKLLIAISALALILNRRRASLPHLFVYCAFLYLSIRSRRNVAFFCLISLPITLRNLAGIRDFFTGRRITLGRQRFVVYPLPVAAAKIIQVFGSAALILFSLLLLFWIATDRYYIRDNRSRNFGLGVRWDQFPQGASDFIETNLPGRFFNNYDIGCFLIWRFFPERNVFIDGRNTLYGEAFLAQPYKWVLGNPENWEKLADEYGIDLAVIRHTAFDVKELIRKLYRDEGWPLVYFDDSTVVFARNRPEYRAAIERFRIDFSRYIEEQETHRWDESILPKWRLGRVTFPFGHLHRAGFFMLLEQYRNAVYEYETAAGLYDSCPEIYNHLGIAYNKNGEPGKAAEAFKQALKLRPGWPGAMNNLGLSCLEGNKPREALATFQKIIKLDDAFVDAYNNAGICYSKLGQPVLAKRMWEAALERDPDYLPARRNLQSQNTLNF